MTKQQIMEIGGKDSRTVVRWIAEAAKTMPSINEKNNAAKRGAPSDYDINEACAILEAGGISRFITSILRENADLKTREDLFRHEMKSQTDAFNARLALMPPPVSEMMTVADFIVEHGLDFPAKCDRVKMYQEIQRRLNTICQDRELPMGIAPDVDVDNIDSLARLVRRYPTDILREVFVGLAIMEA